MAHADLSATEQALYIQATWLPQIAQRSVLEIDTRTHGNPSVPGGPDANVDALRESM